MKPLALFLALAAVACANPYAEAEKADTVEAWDRFIAENPESSYIPAARSRVQDLLIEKARAERTVEAWDAVVARFPDRKGQQFNKVWEERRDFLYAWADETDTPEAWQRFLDDYGTGDKKKKKEARARLKVAGYRDRIAIAPTEVAQINLASDPDGPLNGWGFFTEVTNNTGRDVQYLNLRLSYLDADGRVLDNREWPVVAKALPGYVPMADGFDLPMKDGETRKWKWTTGDMPAGWGKKVRVRAVAIYFDDEGEKQAEEKE